MRDRDRDRFYKVWITVSGSVTEYEVTDLVRDRLREAWLAGRFDGRFAGRDQFPVVFKGLPMTLYIRIAKIDAMVFAH